LLGTDPGPLAAAGELAATQAGAEEEASLAERAEAQAAATAAEAREVRWEEEATAVARVATMAAAQAVEMVAEAMKEMVAVRAVALGTVEEWVVRMEPARVAVVTAKAELERGGEDMATVAVALRREAAEAAVRAAERVVLTVANSATAVATVAAMVVGPPAGREVVGSPAARAATMGSTRKLSTPCESWFQLCASRAAATGVRVSTTPVLDARPAYGEWHFDAGPGEKCHSGILSHARSASRVEIDR